MVLKHAGFCDTPLLEEELEDEELLLEDALLALEAELAELADEALLALDADDALEDELVVLLDEELLLEVSPELLEDDAALEDEDEDEVVSPRCLPPAPLLLELEDVCSHCASPPTPMGSASESPLPPQPTTMKRTVRMRMSVFMSDGTTILASIFPGKILRTHGVH